MLTVMGAPGPCLGAGAGEQVELWNGAPSSTGRNKLQAVMEFVELFNIVSFCGQLTPLCCAPHSGHAIAVLLCVLCESA